MAKDKRKPLAALATTLATTLLACCMPAFAAPPPGDFAASVAHPATWQASAYRGETVAISAQLTGADGRPFPVPEGAEASMLWSTNGVDWFAPRPATVTTGGLIRATWTPDMDCGADSYRIFLRVDDGGTSNINYRANMLLRMLGSPGAVPNELPLPAKTIDFAAVAVSNAPWLEEETDPTVPEWAKSPTPPQESDPTVPEWAKSQTPPLSEESDPVFAEWVGTNSYIKSLPKVNGVQMRPAVYVSGGQWLDVNINTVTQVVIRAGGVGGAITNINTRIDMDVGEGFFEELDSVVLSSLSRYEAEEGFSWWRIFRDDVDVTDRVEQPTRINGEWDVEFSSLPDDGTQHGTGNTNATATRLEWHSGLYVATRTRLRPTPEMEAAWDAKAPASHTHATNDIEHLSEFIAAVSPAPDLSGCSPTGHVHAASDITSGTLDAARIPNLAASKITSGSFAAARIPNLAATKITSGTLADARIPANIARTNDVAAVAQAGTNYTDEVVAGYVAIPKKEMHADSATNIVWMNVYSNGWVFLRAYTNELSEAN